MEIGLPTNVRHVAHVTFDRFNGFLGLPVEFEPEVPRRAPSASATVFGVSTESMQLSYDSRGNSVPTILLKMQRQLYAQGGLQAEGIFRINAENSQEEYVREQLNRGVVPEGIDVHCLAGLIKAWFRELPTGVLDSLSQEQVMQSQSEEECVRLARLLPPTEAALLDWAINLMADVAQLEHLNKMNARNIAMVFAPNMTQDTTGERRSVIESASASSLEPSDENGHQNSHPSFMEANEEFSEGEKEFVSEEPAIGSPTQTCQHDCTTESGCHIFLTSIENITGVNHSLVDTCPCEVASQVNALTNEKLEGGFANKSGGVQRRTFKSRTAQSSNSNIKKGSKSVTEQAMKAAGPVEKSKGVGMVGGINPRTELFEAWRDYALGDNIARSYILKIYVCESQILDQINGHVDPRSLKFKKNIHGKPEVVWQSEDGWCQPHLHFNISHSSSMIACGVTSNSRIGIDVEEKQRKIKNNILAFARRYFSLHEIEYLSSISDSEVQHQEFIKLWTLKEAYVKALGKGFSAAPFKTFTIHVKTDYKRSFVLAEDLLFEASEIMVESLNDPKSLTSSWQFALLELVGSHYAAICMEKDKSIKVGMKVPVRLTAWKTIPFVEDECVSGTDAVIPIGGLIKL
ncbi:hypothetical protein GH714_038229 [Hevea brasiliensis]|uniref:Rho-GAP domain-containing protein n=1 Tax=Hevea brasiliensis TaxID=3981 RepID=A0A6A6L4Y7_HEVBR|nr:hypothetical protein GH714_038229 [Hevea brasiliensis]